VVIWLDESVEVLVQRLMTGKDHRPLIAGMNEHQLNQFLQEKLVERHAYYQQAHYRLSSDKINEAQLKSIISKHAS
jgi:shikimate kinase